MKHCIIVKFKDHENWKSLIGEIQAHFEKAKLIDGVSGLSLKISNSERENRFHLMIELDMTREGLLNFDVSDVHKSWKEKYGELLEAKTIFDYDD